MEQYLIDTNTICDYFSASFSSKSLSFLDEIIDNIPILSVITQIELLSWKTDKAIESGIESFIKDSIILDLSPEVVSKCIEIRRKKKLKTPDAIIAATAVVHNLRIITNNEKDFSNIKNLKIMNPYKI